MLWLIYYLIRHLLIGAVTGALTALTIWTLLILLRDGPSKTWTLVKEMGPLFTEQGYSAQWFVKTGAVVGCVLGMIAAPYLGSVLGRYMWQFPITIPGMDANDVGSLVVGFVSGVIGYLLRVP